AAALSPAGPVRAQEDDATGSGAQPETIEQLDALRNELQAERRRNADRPAGGVPSIDLGRPTPPIEPDDTDIETLPARVGLPATRMVLAPAVLGVAPGESPPTLLREGQFLVNRRGTLKRIDGTGVLLIVFEQRTDRETADAPMVLQACNTLEIVEEMVDRR